MSLADAVLEIADQIEKDTLAVYQETHDTKCHMFSSYARQLRSAVKASQGSSQLGITKEDGLTPEREAVIKRTKDRLEREAEKMAEVMDSSGPSMAELVGGLSDGDNIVIDPKMPVDAKMMIAGQVYVLKSDRKLHFSETDTKEVLELSKK